MRLIVSFLSIPLLILSVSCADSGAEPEDNNNENIVKTVSFMDDVNPILNANCLVCHGGIQTNNNYSVATYLTITEQAGSNGIAVVKGDANSSNLYLKLLETPPFGQRMPRGGPFLTDEEIAKIKTWIDEGAEDN